MSELYAPSIRLLGHPSVAAPAREITFPARGFGLIALLALSPAKTLSRAELASSLWENSSSPASFGNLRQLILRMTRALPSLPSVLTIDERAVRLVAPTEIDICCFLGLEDMSSVAAARSLMDLYRGDLLRGFDLDRSEENPFAIARAYLRERYFGFLVNALRGLTRYGHADAALLRALEAHALGIDDSREDAYRGLIAAYGAIGSSEDSRRLFTLLMDMLRREGAQTPEPQTRTSLARAVLPAVELNAASLGSTSFVSAHVPRIGLLAPNWVAQGGRQNFVRSFVEDVANELARYRSLVTLAAHSSFLAVNDGGVLLDNTAMRTDYTISSVLRPGEGLGTLTVRLVNSLTQSIVWAENFALSHDLLIRSGRVLIARIASLISRAVERDNLNEPIRTKDHSAYLKFLRGQEALKISDLRHVRRARRYYLEALSQDKRFSDAYSGLSCSLYVEWLLLGGNEPKLLSEAEELADLAISHDPFNSTGHWRKAMVTLYQHRFDDSEACFSRAQELHPNSADIMLDHSDALGHVGDADLAWSKFEVAIDLNPMPPDHYWWAGASVAFSQSAYEKVIELCGRLASDEPVLRLLAASHGQLGNRIEARHYGQRLIENYPGETAESMARLQPHRSKSDLQPFINGLRIAGIK